MAKTVPSPGRLAAMIIFALSCFGLLLFLWLSFGGPVPLKPKGYRVQVAFPEAATLGLEAEVRVAGVPVGNVVAKDLDRKANRTIATLELDRRFAPLSARGAGDPAREDPAGRDLRRADTRVGRAVGARERPPRGRARR